MISPNIVKNGCNAKRYSFLSELTISSRLCFVFFHFNDFADFGVVEFDLFEQ